VNIIRSYGWKPSLPDLRDHVYAAPRWAAEQLPASVDLSSPPRPGWEPAWQQGNLGSCGPHSACADIVYALMRAGVERPVMPSRLFVYYVTRVLQNTVASDSGVSNRDMLKALAKYGYCDESLWPYVPSKFAVKPPPEAFEQAARRTITGYLSVPQDLDQMRACLAGGDPFILGFTCYSSLETPEVDRTGDIPIPKRGERAVGGHDVLCVGYDDATQRFKVRNSWGVSWGRSGYGTIPYQYALDRQLAGDFWTVRYARPDAAPVPTPAPTPAGRKLVLEWDDAGKRVRVAAPDGFAVEQVKV
jgi:C1A family cysteine protease